MYDINDNEEFMQPLPRKVKTYIIMNYMFDDIIYNHRFFFDMKMNLSQYFIQDICYGLKPAFYQAQEDDLILDEEEDVSDMYFLKDGEVGIGYYLMTQGLSNKKSCNFPIKKKVNSYICDYYVLFCKKSEFIYVALEDVEAFSLSKKLLKRKKN